MTIVAIFIQPISKLNFLLTELEFEWLVHSQNKIEQVEGSDLTPYQLITHPTVFSATPLPTKLDMYLWINVLESAQKARLIISAIGNPLLHANDVAARRTS